MIVLILSSRCILDWERVKVSDTLHVSVRVELISNSGSALHLDEIEWATNWGMHILELPFALLLLPISHLSLPNLSILHLGIFLSLRSHGENSLIVLNLSIKLGFLNMSLIFQLINLFHEATLSSAKGRASSKHILFDLLETILVMGITAIRELIDWILEHIWYSSLSLGKEILVDIQLGLCLIRSLISIESVSHCHCVHELFCWLIMA